jgi:hypothetical protein
MSLRPLLGVFFAATLAFGASAASTPPRPDATTVKAALERARANLDDPAAQRALLAVLPVVTLSEGGARRTYYVFEGDILLSPEQVTAMLRASVEDAARLRAIDQRTRTRSKAGAPARKPSGLELVILRDQGRDVFWPKGSRALTYAVDRASFGNDAAGLRRYARVGQEFEQAAKAWMDVCPTCGLSFTHKAALDAGHDFSAATFVIRYDRGVTAFMAESFFPNQRLARTVTVAPSFFTTTSVDTTGVLRHEIGHILGYRHEHIQGVRGCSSEAGYGDWRAVTPYNSDSVMHYLCGGGGSPRLLITSDDQAGHRRVYS